MPEQPKSSSPSSTARAFQDVAKKTTSTLGGFMKQAFHSVEEQFNQVSLAAEQSSSSGTTAGQLKSSGSANWGIMDFDNPLFSDSSVVNSRQKQKSDVEAPPTLPPRTDNGSPLKVALQPAKSDDSGLGVSPSVAKDANQESSKVSTQNRDEPEESSGDFLSSMLQKIPTKAIERSSLLLKQSLMSRAPLSTSTSSYSVSDERFMSVDGDLNAGISGQSTNASDSNIALFTMNDMPGNFPTVSFRGRDIDSTADPSLSTTRSASEPGDEEIITNVLETSSSKASEAQQKLAQILGERERQLISASEQNASLNSSLDAFREQVSDLQRQIQGLQTEISVKTNEIEHMKSSSRHEPASGTNSKFIEELQRALKTKTEQHQALMEEGNQLSIANGKLNAAIKKLRQQVEETQESLTESEKKNTDFQQQLSTAKETISSLQASEKALQSQTAALSQANEEMTKKLQQLEKDLNDSREKESTLQSSLDRAWQEISDLKRSNAAAASEEFQAALQKEQAINIELKQQVQSLKLEFAETEQTLKKEIFHFKSSVTRLENEINWSDESHRKEIMSYQQKLQAAELRNDDLSQSIQESTKPLLRQIESLQSHSNSLQDTFKSLESNLTKQLHQTCVERDSLLNSNREANLRISEFERKVLYLNESIDKYQSEKTSTSALMDEQASQIKILNEKTQELETRLAKAAQDAYANLEIAKAEVRESLVTEYELQMQDRDLKLKEAEETIQEKQAEIERMRQKQTKEVEVGASRDGLVSPGLSFNRAGSITASTILASPALQSYTAEVHQNLRITSLENQLAHMEQQLKNALNAREQISEDLVRLTVDHNKLKANSQDTVQLQANYENLQKILETKNSELLQKNHVISEMREDINDMKQMYRSQIDELTNRLEKYDVQHRAKTRQQSLA